MQTYFGWAKPCSCSHCCSRHLWSHDSLRLGRVEVIVTLRVGARAKEGKGGFLFSLPTPSPLPLTRPISSSLREVSTWRFREQKHLRARRKRLHYRLHSSLHSCMRKERWIHTRDLREAVRNFLPAQFPWNWCKCLLRNFVHSKIFNLTKYREVPVKYFTAHYACRNADLNLTLVTGTTNGFKLNHIH